MCLLEYLLRQVPPRSQCSTVFVVVALARARLAFGGGVYAHFWLITRASSDGCAVRCFRGLLRWRVLVALIKETGVVVRLRLRLRRNGRPPPTPATDARHRRPPYLVVFPAPLPTTRPFLLLLYGMVGPRPQHTHYMVPQPTSGAVLAL